MKHFRAWRNESQIQSKTLQLFVPLFIHVFFYVFLKNKKTKLNIYIVINMYLHAFRALIMLCLMEVSESLDTCVILKEPSTCSASTHA